MMIGSSANKAGLRLPAGTDASGLDRDTLYRVLAQLNVTGVAPDDGRGVLLDKLSVFMDGITRTLWP
jgi:hypothetical protein